MTEPQPREITPDLELPYGLAASGPGETAMFAWESECVRMGLLEPLDPKAPWQERHSKRTSFRTARAALLAAEMIGVDRQRVMDRTRKWT
jgi:hypothetical protein